MSARCRGRGRAGVAMPPMMGLAPISRAAPKQWAQKYPHTLAAFERALEQGQQIADTDRAAVQKAFEGLRPPLNVTEQTAAVMSLDSYPFSTDPSDSVDRVRLQRVVDVMSQFLGFQASFNISSMLIGG